MNIVLVRGPNLTTGLTQMTRTTHCHLVDQNFAQKRFHIINLYTLGC